MDPVAEGRVDEFLVSERLELYILYEGVTSFSVTIVLVIFLEPVERGLEEEEDKCGEIQSFHYL